jgi:diguanylate cyclase (GGDEF)-like protein
MKKTSPLQKATPNLLDIYGDIQRITRIFYVFTFVILASFIAGIFILLSHNDNSQAAFLTACLPLILLGLFFISKKEFERAAIFLAIILFSLLTIIATNGLGIHQISNLGFPAILIVSSLVIRKRTLIVITGFAIACAGWLVFGEVWGVYSPQVLEKSVPGDFFSVAVMIIATSIMVRLLTESVFQSSLEVQKELRERKRAEERLAYDALHDGLTNLPNRTLFMDRLGQRLELSRRHPKDLFAVLFIDLDRFKVINDSLGHAVGDQLLIATAQRLKQCLRPEDTVSRLSGDEFAILLNDFNESSDAIRVAERILGQLASTSMIENLNRVTTASIGIAVFNGNYTHPQELLRDADSAMYRAKALGGGHYQIFDTSMYASAVALLQMEADLKRAVENQEWEVFYQPIISLPDLKFVGVEALVRWIHPQRGICLPAEFIHVAEETGLILPIGEYVLQKACSQIKSWRESKNPDLWVSVNLSGRQFQDNNLVNAISQILAETGLPGEGLQLEITESVAMKDIAYSIRVLNDLNQLGIQISLDDFGNGYSSLGYLNRFPVKVLKIDRTFIQDIVGNRNNEAICTAIISMGHTLNMEVIAEGVETEKQLIFLESVACNKVQGYLFSRPLPPDELDKLLSTTRQTLLQKLSFPYAAADLNVSP